MGRHVHNRPHHRPPRPTTEPHREEPRPDPAPTHPEPHAAPSSFPQVGFNIDIPNPLTPDLRTSPAATSVFRSPLTQGAVGMVPIAAPPTPSTTITRNEQEVLDLRFKEERRRLENAALTQRGRAQQQTRARLQQLTTTQEHLGRLKISGQTRRNLRTLRETAHRDLIEGTLDNQPARVDHGVRITNAFEAYHRVEDRQAAVYDMLSRLYPETSTQGIRLEYAEAARNLRGETQGHGLYEPSLEFMRSLAIVRTYQRLRNGTPEERAQASAIAAVIGDINAPSFLSDPDNVEFLETETGRLATIYTPTPNETDPLNRFFGSVHATQLQDLAQNPGYQNRQALETSLSQLTSHAQVLHLLESHYHQGTLPPNILNALKENLLQSAHAIQRQTQERIHTLEVARQARTTRTMDDGHWVTETIPAGEPSAEEVTLRSRLTRLDQTIHQIEAFDSSSPEATSQMERHLRVMTGYEEESIREGVRVEGHLLSHPPADISLTGTLLERTQSYRATLDQTDVSLMQQNIQERIAMYQQMRTAGQRADRVLSLPMQLSGWDPVHTTSGFDAIIERYQHIQELIQQGHVGEASRALTSLEQAQIGPHLQEHAAVSGHINTATAIGILAASALAMNVGGLLIAPELALGAEAAEATFATRAAYTAATAPLFRITHNSLDAWMSGEHARDVIQRVVDNPGTTARNFALDTGNDIVMMMTLQTALRGFQSFAQTRVGQIAQAQLQAEGRLVGDNTQAVIAERTQQLMQGLGTRAATTAGAFGTELSALQAWGFVSTTAHNRLKHGEWRPGEALMQTVLNRHSWVDQAVFITGMRVGHVLSNPLFNPIQAEARDAAVARVQRRYNDVLARSEAAGRAWNEYVRTGEGDVDALYRDFESALERRLELAQHPSVRTIVRPEVIAETEQALRTARNERGRIYEASQRGPMSWGTALAMGLMMPLMGADGGVGGAIVDRTARRPTPSRVSSSSPAENPHLTTIRRALGRINPNHLSFHAAPTTHPGELRISVNSRNRTKLHQTLLGIARNNGLAIVSDPGADTVILRPSDSRNSTKGQVVIHVVTPPELPQRPPIQRTGRHSPRALAERPSPWPDPRLPLSRTVARGAPPYTPPPVTEAATQDINLTDQPLPLGETRQFRVLEGAPAHIALRRAEDGRLFVNNQTGVPVTLWHTSGEIEQIPASQRRLDFPLNSGDHIVIGEGDTARHLVIRDNPQAFTRRPVERTSPPELTQPLSLDIYHFCHSPLGPASERGRGVGYSFQSGSRNLTILHGVGNRNEAKSILRNQAAARNIPITEISETHWRLGGSDGVDVNFQALNPEHIPTGPVNSGVRFPYVTVRDTEKIAHYLGLELEKLGYPKPTLEQLESPEFRNTIAGRVFDALMRHASNHPTRTALAALPTRLRNEINNNTNNTPVVPEVSNPSSNPPSQPISSTVQGAPSIPIDTESALPPSLTNSTPNRWETIISRQAQEITIGSSAEANIHLEGASPRHVRLLVTQQGILLRPAESNDRVYYENKSHTQGQPEWNPVGIGHTREIVTLSSGDRFRVGEDGGAIFHIRRETRDGTSRFIIEREIN